MNPWTLLPIAGTAGCSGAAFIPPDAAGLDTVATQDGSPDSASDAPVVTNDGGGIAFACGSVATCDGRSQVCEHVMGGAPPGVDFYDCIPIPPACGSDVSCGCVTTALKGRGAGECSEIAGNLTVAIDAP